MQLPKHVTGPKSVSHDEFSGSSKEAVRNIAVQLAPYRVPWRAVSRTSSSFLQNDPQASHSQLDHYELLAQRSTVI